MHTLEKSSLLLLLLGILALHSVACGKGASSAQGAANTPAPTPTPTQSAGGVTISTPAGGATVASPFTLSASASTCSSQTVTSMGYSFDSAATTTVNAASINSQVTAAAGAHTLNVKAWGSGGAVCSSSVAITVSAPSNSSTVPSNAVNVSSLQTMSNWQEQHDPATGASSSGSMSMVSSPSLSGNARQFITTYSGSGGEIYHISFGSDTTATNFFYDAEVYFDKSVSTVANLEMDMNQVLANGETIIYGFQCDGYSGTWDYTENAGTPTSPNDRWVHSSSACNVRNWTVNQWHHIQVSYSRDNSGNVTYHSVWLDGVENKLDATVPSAFALGWGSVLLTNFQIDGLGSGSSTVYLDNLTISRW